MEPMAHASLLGTTASGGLLLDSDTGGNFRRVLRDAGGSGDLLGRGPVEPSARERLECRSEDGLAALCGGLSRRCH
jgi:hypothetical protein